MWVSSNLSDGVLSSLWCYTFGGTSRQKFRTWSKPCSLVKGPQHKPQKVKIRLANQFKTLLVTIQMMPPKLQKPCSTQAATTVRQQTLHQLSRLRLILLMDLGHHKEGHFRFRMLGFIQSMAWLQGILLPETQVSSCYDHWAGDPVGTEPTQATTAEANDVRPNQTIKSNFCPMILLRSLGPPRDSHFGTKRMMENLTMEDSQLGIHTLLNGNTKLNLMKLRMLRWEVTSNH